jgi:hypothetical protein
MNDQAINWIFLVDTLNFSFWSENKDNNSKEIKYQVVYNNKTWEGYWALCAAINRALDVCLFGFIFFLFFLLILLLLLLFKSKGRLSNS